MANANEIVLPETKEAQLKLLKKLCDPEAGGQLAEVDVREVMIEQFGDRARAAANVDLSSTAEVTPEALAACLKGLEADYKRGIVAVDDKGTVDDFKIALKQDKTAGTTWEQVTARLAANDNALLKKAAGMQGKGTLIGVYLNGELCITDRGNEPVIFGKDEVGKQVKITTDTPDRTAAMQGVKQFADYWEIRKAVHDEGFTLPPDAPDYKKKGLVAAVEAITDADFVRSANGTEYRSAVLDCGNVQRSADVRVVFFSPAYGRAFVGVNFANSRSVDRGAVRVLRG